MGRKLFHQVRQISKTMLKYKALLGSVFAPLLWIGFPSSQFWLPLFTSDVEIQSDYLNLHFPMKLRVWHLVDLDCLAIDAGNGATGSS
jgi:hypothetical protein